MVNLMAWLDGGNRERERDGVEGGLSLGSPWRDMVGVIMEAHAQTLQTIMHVHDRHGPRGVAP